MDYKLAIITQDLSKNYGNTLAVKNLNLNVPYGIIYGLLGPNGAGKTTTVKMLNSMIEPSSGNAKVMNYDIITQKREVKLNCGYLSESPSLYEKLTAREFLEFVGELYYITPRMNAKRISELLVLFDLTNKENKLVKTFSRGMKQKLGLCAALIHDPEILFLDEPTSNLDPETSRTVKDLVLDLVKKVNRTIFICTHLLDIAEELCDKIGIINNGTLLIEGKPRDLVKSVDAKDLEDAYLKMLRISRNKNVLSWR
ncbi:MAG: ABC transporter ATP-binding protein [Candidatus Lokiarchaeota archaeon]|nr:ABC transporter ATP-binding protein [Candidatus Lokiarchaeota archaeon]